MTEIIDHLDKAILCCVTGKAYGLCRQVTTKEGEVYPVTEEMVMGKYLRVTPEDNHKVLWYHRLENSAENDSDVYSFGRVSTKMNSTTVRTILVSEFALRDTALDSMTDAMVGFMSPFKANILKLPDYKYVEFGDTINVSRDRAAIWTAEWGNAYKDKYQMRYNIYAIEFTIDTIRCHECAVAD